MDLTEPTTTGFNTLVRNTEPGAEPGAITLITVPTLVPSAPASLSTITPTTVAPATIARLNPAREIASWRQLKMWEDGESLGSAATVKLIGVHEGKSLLVTTPTDGEVALDEGRVYRFRSFSGEYIYEFAAPLLKICDAPFDYLHVGWSSSRQVDKRNLRAARRVKTDLQCIIYPGGTQASGRFAKGMIHDLSTAGAAITLQDELSVFYDEVRVVFRVVVADQEILIEARARAVRKPEPNTVDATLGVAFVGLSDLDRLALHAFVNAAVVRDLEVPLYA